MPENKKNKYKDYDLDNNIGFLVSDAHHLVTAVVDKVMNPLGLTRSQLRVLLFLMRQDGYTQVELAEQLEIGKVAMGGLLDRLEKKALINRRTHQEDKRAKRIYLSKKINKLYTPMQELGDGLMEKLLEDINQKQQKQFVNNLKMLKRNCRQILDQA